MKDINVSKLSMRKISEIFRQRFEYREILLRYLEQKVTKPVDIGLSAALILLVTPSNGYATIFL